MKWTRPQGITTFPFGHVEAPISVNSDEGCLETIITYGKEDLFNLVQSISCYYKLKSDRTQRQDEIADLMLKASKLIKKEKGVVCRLWSPIIIQKPDNKKEEEK